jgi:hypothetical protein
MVLGLITIIAGILPELKYDSNVVSYCPLGLAGSTVSLGIDPHHRFPASVTHSFEKFFSI